MTDQELLHKALRMSDDQAIDSLALKVKDPEIRNQVYLRASYIRHRKEYECGTL